MKQEVLIEYPNCNHYYETMETTEYYCLNCGKQTVWTDGIYWDEEGMTHYCISCNSEWASDDVSKATGHSLKIINQIVNKKADTPTRENIPKPISPMADEFQRKLLNKVKGNIAK